MAGEVAGAGLQLLVDQLNEGVDELKSMLTPPIDTIKTHATDLGEFMQIVTNEAREQIDLDAGAGGRHQGEAGQVQQLRGRREHDHPADLRHGRAGVGLQGRRHPPAVGRGRGDDRRGHRVGDGAGQRRSRPSRPPARPPPRRPTAPPTRPRAVPPAGGRGLRVRPRRRAAPGPARACGRRGRGRRGRQRAPGRGRRCCRLAAGGGAVRRGRRA